MFSAIAEDVEHHLPVHHLDKELTKSSSWWVKATAFWEFEASWMISHPRSSFATSSSVTVDATRPVIGYISDFGLGSGELDVVGGERFALKRIDKALG